MRNTPPEIRGDWATFAQRSRAGANSGRGLSQSELARRLGVDRVTVWRWENSLQKPSDAELVARFAQVTGVDQDEALAAAGLRPGEVAPVEPTREIDEEIQLVVTDSRLSPATKKRIIDHILERRERERAQGVEQTRILIETMRDQRDVG